MLLRECQAYGLRAVMVASAVKGEGKSSLASHLAISLARTGQRTLLADFDLRSPWRISSSISPPARASPSSSAVRPTSTTSRSP